MHSIRYKEYSTNRFEIVGKDEALLAFVERDSDGLWRILPQPEWVPSEGFNVGPFHSPDDAFEELKAVPAEQS